MRIRFTGARRGGLVEVGKIVKPQGVKGEVKIIPFAGGGDFPAGRELFLLDASGRARSYRLLAARARAEAVIVQLAGVDDRDGAEALRGLVVAVALADLPPLAADEIYWNQLAGLPARTADGREIGTVRDFLLTGARPILVIVDEAGREYLVPAHEEFMTIQGGAAQGGAAAEAAWLRLTPPPGLLDL